MPPSTPSARVIADSHSRQGVRLTTIEARCHRFVLAELNTHRAFSRNSASSRAIPFKKQLERVLTDPAIPISFPAEQSGMQGGEELDDGARSLALLHWINARDNAAREADELSLLGVHKSVVNRLLEPFMWHTVILSSVEWENFFWQRCSPLAQPEIQAVAYAIRDALYASEPKLVQVGDWHLPYITDEDLAECDDRGLDPRHISVARCARVSYLTHDGVRDLAKDEEMYARLTSADPPHASPLEHVATPMPALGFMQMGNFLGWHQLRHLELGR